MTDDIIERFKRDRLKSRPMPADLAVLLQLQLSRTSSEAEPVSLLDEIQCRILLPDDEAVLLSHDYLNAQDRANPDIMSNVAAIDQVFAYISFVAVNDHDEGIGYWHGPEQIDINSASIIKYDTEGQFSLLCGSHLTEAMVSDVVFDDEDAFSSLSARFADAGIVFSASTTQQLVMPTPATDPGALHHQYYNAERAKRGLDAV